MFLFVFDRVYLFPNIFVECCLQIQHFKVARNVKKKKNCLNYINQYKGIFCFFGALSVYVFFRWMSENVHCTYVEKFILFISFTFCFNFF